MVIVDTSASEQMDSEARHTLTRQGRAMAEAGHFHCLGAALVVTNRFQRGVAQVFAWFADGLEVSVQPNRIQAEAWARQRLLQAGLSPRPQLSGPHAP